MLFNVKKYGVIVIIAVLLSLFAFSIVDLIQESPKYEDYCGSEIFPRKIATDSTNCPDFIEPSDLEVRECNVNKGDIQYKYDGKGCVVSYECNTCRIGFDEESKKHRLLGFIVTTVFGVMAILVGLYSKGKEEVIEWIFSGILIGGILSIIFGTVSYFNDMGRFVKPIILIVELGLIILIALRTAKKRK